MPPETRLLDDLTAFQRDLLTVVSMLVAPNGLEVKGELQHEYKETVRKSRLYDNLDELAGKGLIERTEVTRRENAYTLTKKGEEALAADLEWRERAIGD